VLEIHRRGRFRALASRRSALVLGAVGLGLASLLFGPSRRARAQRERRLPPGAWTLFYGQSVESWQLEGYDVIVLDPGFLGSVRSLSDSGKAVLGYLTVGEIKSSGPLFGRLTDQAALLHENPNWPGTYAADVRHPAWRKLIFDEAVPQLLARGFSGVFVDTLDMPPYLEETDPVRCAGMRAATIDLMRELRERLPGTPIVVNRGYAVLGEIAPFVDGVVAESMLTTYDFAKKEYQEVDPDTVATHLALLKPARDLDPPLPILSLDYWNPEDREGLRAIYARERSLGHRPCVATILLDRIVPEPT
jgi:polysaccharide biosynthesis protein PelA